ncbi:homocitrate synthase [Oscillospiraceae bacterium MB08-C2-2]|nr:homocitrate synthase [Oscillospiraceae bacterium MB08-C2-2]
MNPVCYIVDTTLRDGEQSPSVAMSMEQKVEIASLLEHAGVYQLEAGTPAMGEYEIETIRAIMNKRSRIKVSTWNRMREDDIAKSFSCKPDIIHISAPVSYAQIYTKLNKNKAWLLKKLLYLVDLVRQEGYEVTVGFEDATRADMSFLISLSHRLHEVGVSRIRVADTVGVSAPGPIAEMVHQLKVGCGLPIEIHSHNDLGMAVATSVAAAKSGAEYINTTLGGIGERAGNCRFGEFVFAAERLFQLSLNAQQAFALEHKMQTIVGTEKIPIC